MTKVRKFWRGAVTARALQLMGALRGGWWSPAALRRPLGYVLAALAALVWMALGWAAAAASSTAAALWGAR